MLTGGCEASRRFILTRAALAAMATILHASHGLAAAGADVAQPDTLRVPTMTTAQAAAGCRVRQTPPEYAGSDVHHSLYLPPDWQSDWKKSGKRWPMIVEYTGNYMPSPGSTGEVSNAALGFGLCGGKGYLWIVMPYVAQDHRHNERTWWGDVDATVQYCKTNLPRICDAYGGDPRAVVLCGFSRGAIGVNYIGLHDDQIAAFWAGFVTHDHYDGVLEWKGQAWGSPLAAYQAEARKRLKRLAGRRVLVCQDGLHGTDATRQFIGEQTREGRFTFLDVPVKEIFTTIPNRWFYQSHTDRWLLRDSVWRRHVWQWMAETVSLARQARSKVVATSVTAQAAAGELVSPLHEKAPYRILYSNDLTNILGCPTPDKPAYVPFREDMLRRSVAETAGTGVNVHMLQPGLGWVPLWSSRVAPISEHLAYLRRAGRKPADSLETYVANGGDVIKVFVDECRARKLVPFISMRMNDMHHVMRGNSAIEPAQREKAMAEFQFFADHPEWRMGDSHPSKSLRQAFDWANPPVREYRMALLREICENYEIDGLELDFMRAYAYFNPARTPVAERRTIMAEFVHGVRQLLDRTARNGKHRWLCVRIPGYPAAYDEAGIDLKSWCDGGVDMVNVSGHYFTDQQLEIAAIRRQLPPHVALYAEMQFVTALGTAPVVAVPGGMAKVIHRRTTDAQFNTTAALAYARGADGVSLFNFQYYRGTYNKHDVDGRGVEPPFGVLAHLGDCQGLASQPQNFFLGYQWDTPHRPDRPFYLNPSHADQAQTLTFDLISPPGGWSQDGRLRIQGRNSLGERQWKTVFNGVELRPTANTAEFPPSPYDTAIGKPDDYRAWIIPAKLLQAGPNRVDLTLTHGGTVQLFYADIAFPPAESQAKQSR